MIDKKDLRIGNVIQFENGELIEVDTISYDEVNKLDTCIGYDLVDCFPIALTEKILKDLGFKYSKGLNEFWFNGKFRLAINEDFKICYEFENYQVKLDDIVLEYLHELQNIYFTFTKQELQIDINTLKV
jgi:hypothetical protein